VTKAEYQNYGISSSQGCQLPCTCANEIAHTRLPDYVRMYICMYVYHLVEPLRTITIWKEHITYDIKYL